MKIVVAVRQAVALDEGFELSSDGRGVDLDFVDRDINEWDTYSLEEALALKDDGDADVIVVTVGDEEADDTLLACLAKGADRAIRVERDVEATFDPLVTAQLLTAVIRRESPDLVLCGVQSSDTLSGATGGAVAALLGVPCAAVVHRIEIKDSSAVIERELEGGAVEVLALPLPAVITVQTGINEPRYATLRAIKQAKEKPLDVLSAQELRLDAAALERFAGARLRKLTIPEQEASAEMIAGDAAAVADRIVELVAERLS